MRALLQRVNRATVRVLAPAGTSPAGGPPAEVESSVGRGLLILLGVGAGDDAKAAERLAEKCVHLRIFPDEQGKFSRSLIDVGGGALVVSQFTLYGDCSKGRRPEFTGAMPTAQAEPLYQCFLKEMAGRGVLCRSGEFGARMEVELVNDGPVTVWLDSAQL